uniref:NADP-dependent oxidoreductase domain-containing protein n=1 Tax=Timspurckia oligopyrenoides TaxID=708627 RepID=A0A7S0ZBA4_9RHOD|mmetsp:Transcript_11137/g.20126  ORF Transcript_11137/g.20126 Transcript_11137/m.20126 type:complete len:381 (+) Transcript_11137:123-1265(+)|eukprot:CAMPEP_0182447832 /NCGR_PEP_ID=MMETSP1172-20130603/20736_1 /TAXON_ID=708627 /ORGANISM="Timspurckia oligopyrenoides, Strain CCMP3278" /LENGTH=380 /DNA_ID=CAMNT_0024644433 /DNA_START=45 /DNA_END=1187 /DNA_ORIENTATION=-
MVTRSHSIGFISGSFDSVVNLERQQEKKSHRRKVLCRLETGQGLPLGNLAGGTWSWGNRVLWQYDPSQDAEIYQSFETLVKGGVFFFDTGDSYGTGRALNARAEVLLGEFRSQLSPGAAAQLTFGTKLASYPWRWTKKSLAAAASASAIRLSPNTANNSDTSNERPCLDMAMMHWSPRNYLPLQERFLLEAFADLKVSGLARNIGVSNLGPRRLEASIRFLRDNYDVSLSVLQLQFSLLSAKPLETGVLDIAAESGIPVLGYSPLCLGFLGADESRLRSTKGLRGNVFRYLLDDKAVVDLRRLITEIAEQRGNGMRAGDVAIAWVRSKGATPLVGVRSLENAQNIVQHMNTFLNNEELDELDRATKKLKRKAVQNIFMTN